MAYNHDLAYYGIGPEPDLPPSRTRDPRRDEIDELKERLAAVEAQLAAKRRIRPGFWPGS